MPGPLKRPSGSQKFSKAKRPATRKKKATGTQLGSGLQKQELKVLDTAQSFSFDTTGEVPAGGQLCLVTVGDTLNNRDGAVIQVKSVQIRGNLVYVPGAAASAATTCVLYLVQDRQCNGAAAAATDVLTGTAFQNAMPNVPNQYRFKILRRWAFTFNATAGVTTAYNNFVHHMDEYVKFNTPVEIRYTASAGAITDIASNNLFLLAGSDGGSDDLVTVSMQTRIRFTG